MSDLMCPPSLRSSEKQGPTESQAAKSRLFISFSGGRTSAYMTKRLLDLAAERNDGTEIVVLFANTGQEHEETLRFVDRCDKHFGFNVVWVEAVVDPEHGKGTGFRVATFETAARRGEPFEPVIKKYGIPNSSFPHCTRETKERPMTAYLRSIGWDAGTYDTAIGLRSDEKGRKNSKAKELRLIYPLIKWGVTKQAVLSWWAQQPFDLNLPEHWGNCLTCWKKSDRKLATIARERPEWFDFFRRMEATYPDAGPGDGRDRPRRFFRGKKTVNDIFAIGMSNTFVPYTPDTELQFEMDMFGFVVLDDLDLGGGCGDSCEVFSDSAGEAA
ncbi:hypothetical protein FHR70_003789 [Microvirga lupini]|uniref:Phosphoadenosine phosphosulphate reductase domain-containing protein n=1 Tax=Microvirga lupini TaxID=420324 RepID=A0A7W4VP12_9HYPH|nr:phosphoadenosine phosphosulfate reductase family protein [Microvirga lupini]MBB3020703.1 hypothetical protein [Microvirga lupini]